MAVRFLFVALIIALSGPLSAAPAPLAKRERPKAEPPLEQLKRVLAENSGFQVREMTQEGSRCLVKCSNADGTYVVTFTVNNAPTRQAALRKLIELYCPRHLLPPELKS
jgi:hypothetical protein